MQASGRPGLRKSPFGDVVRCPDTRPSAIDVADRPRTGHAKPRPYEIFRLQPALDGVSGAPVVPLRAAFAEPPQADTSLYRAMGRLTWSVARLAIRGMVGRVVAHGRRRGPRSRAGCPIERLSSPPQ